MPLVPPKTTIPCNPVVQESLHNELHKFPEGRPVAARHAQGSEVKVLDQGGELPRSCQPSAIDAWKVHHERQVCGLDARVPRRNVRADEARRTACREGPLGPRCCMWSALSSSFPCGSGCEEGKSWGFRRTVIAQNVDQPYPVGIIVHEGGSVEVHDRCPDSWLPSHPSAPELCPAVPPRGELRFLDPSNCRPSAIAVLTSLLSCAMLFSYCLRLLLRLGHSPGCKTCACKSTSSELPTREDYLLASLLSHTLSAASWTLCRQESYNGRSIDQAANSYLNLNLQ